MKKELRERRLIWQAAAGMCIVVVLAALAVAVILRHSNNMETTRHALGRAFAARVHILDVALLMQGAETGQRGYLLSGDTSFLRPYQQAVALHASQFRELREALGHSESLLARVDAIQQLADGKMREMAHVLDVHHSEGPEAAMEFVRAGEGRDIMDRLRQQVRDLLQAESMERASWLAEGHEQERRFRHLVVGLIAAIVFCVAGAAMVVLMHLRQQLRIGVALRMERHRAYGLQRIAEAGGLSSDFPAALAGTLATLAELVGARAGAAVSRVAAQGAREDQVLAWPAAAPLACAAEAIWHEARGIVVRRADESPDRRIRVYIPVWDFRTQVASMMIDVDAQGLNHETVSILAESAARQLAHAAERQRILDLRSKALTSSKALFDGAIDGFLSVNEEGSIERVNPAAAALFGYSADALQHQHISIVLPGIVESPQGLQLSPAGRAGVGRVRESLGLHSQSGSFPVDIALSEIQLFGKRTVVISVRDATARKRAETLKNQFVSTVSHELRTPLTAISGSLRLLAAGAVGELPGKALRLVEIAHNNSERLGRLVNDILDIEKIESGTVHLQIEPVSLDDLVPATIELNHAYAQRHGIRLCLQTQAPGLRVMADADRLTQVLTNLLSNAIKFSPQGSVVTVAVGCQDGMARLSVTDCGPGIAPDFQPSLFDRFSQADASDQRLRGGTGLGLNIVKELIERQHGRISFVTSSEGTRFMADLPLAA